MKKIILTAALTAFAAVAMADSGYVPPPAPDATRAAVLAAPTQVPANPAEPTPVGGPPAAMTPVVTFLAGGVPAITATVKSLVPVNVQFDMSGVTKIRISWISPDGEKLTFNVLRKTAAEADFKIINAEPIKVTAYTDANITSATAYDYKIEAMDNSGNSYVSAIQSVKSAGLGPPLKPFTFKTFQDIENVSIKWSAGTRGSFEISGYNLYRGKTPDKMELFKFINAQATKYDDDTVEPAIKYYYYMKTIDVSGYESEPTETEAVVPFPRPRTGLVLTSSGYRNNIYDNFGLNADFLFTYYIGSIFSDYQGKGDSLGQISVILFTGDIKGTIFNEFESWPSLGLGFTYTVLLQYNLGGSDATGAAASFTSKDSVTQMYGLYLTASKKIIWDNTLHAGFMSGFGSNAQTRFMAYLSPYLSDLEDGNIKQSNFAYYLGFGRPLFGKMEIKAELIVPVEANKNALFPNYYLINTHIENFLRFDFGYFHFPGGSAFVGFINFRFSVYPNPYK